MNELEYPNPVSRANSGGDKYKADEVARELAQLCVDGQLPAGTLLASENKLSRLYGVSRPNIRRALHRLVTAGLVETRHGVGSFVGPKEKWNLFDPMLLQALMRNNSLSAIAEELVELRKMVEVESAGLAATRISTSELRQLERWLGRMKAALNQVELVTESDLAFHEIIVSASRNRFLQGIMSYLQEPLERARYLTMETGGSEGRMRAYRSHQAIFEAIAARDVSRARQAMSEHMEQLEKDMRAALLVLQ